MTKKSVHWAKTKRYTVFSQLDIGDMFTDSFNNIWMKVGEVFTESRRINSVRFISGEYGYINDTWQVTKIDEMNVTVKLS